MSKIGTLIGLYALAGMTGMMDVGNIFDQKVSRHRRHDEKKEDMSATKEYYLKKAAEKRRRKIERLKKSCLAPGTPVSGADKNPI